MKIIKSIKELPRWFHLDNYESLYLLDTDELLTQIDLRSFMLKLIQFEFIENATFTNIISKAQWSLITSGCGIVTDVVQLDEDDLIPTLPSYGAVKPLTASHAICFTHQLIKEDRLIAAKNEFKALDHAAYSEQFDLVDLNNSGYLVHIAINLLENSDTKIISDLTKLLPHFRKVLSINEPDDNIHSKPSHFQKILNYKIIPLLDLKIWALLENIKIPHSVLTVALFPNGEKGETELKQTVIPFLELILSEDYRVIE